MSSAGSPRKQAPGSPSKRLKRKAADVDDAADPSASAGRGRTASASPFRPDSASSSTTPSPVKRTSTSSTSRRDSRASRTFQISDDFGQDEDAPYDEELDADGEFDEEYVGQDAQGEEEDDEVEKVVATRASSSTSTMTPSRQSARPKRSNAPNVSYYAVQPLPSFSDDEQDEEVTPSIRRRGRKAKLPDTSDNDVDTDDDDAEDHIRPTARSSSRGTRTDTPSTSKQLSGKTPRRPIDKDVSEQSSVKPPEPELSEEAKQQAKAEKEAHDLQSRWTEEYFEIVEQLPLEMHRTFALMRELEGQMQARVGTMVQNMTAYRDVRMEMQNLLDAGSPEEQTNTRVNEQSSSRKSARGGSEDEAENLLGGSQDGHRNGQSSAFQDDIDGVEVHSADGIQAKNLFDKDARRQLLRSISLAANESVKAAEEKMGLAATAYNWIDRHIRRLDADISKVESSILLGLRSGTEESRNAREALGLPVDDAGEEGAEDGEDGRTHAGEGISAEAESAALTKAAGAARRASAGGAEGGRRSTRTTPKMGGQAQLAPSPKGTQRSLSRSRSRSASTSAAAGSSTDKTTAAASVSTTRAGRQKTTSPAPLVANARITRKRKPKPLSPQKGGRRSIVTATPTIVSPTTQLPRSSGTIVGPDTSEMPFDPTEPTYCYCDQISFDEMVACDNEDCTIEWFHYACVGLTRQPKNEWFCRFCAPPGWKGEGMAVPSNAKHRPPGFKKGVGIKA